MLFSYRSARLNGRFQNFSPPRVSIFCLFSVEISRPGRRNDFRRTWALLSFLPRRPTLSGAPPGAARARQRAAERRRRRAAPLPRVRGGVFSARGLPRGRAALAGETRPSLLGPGAAARTGRGILTCFPGFFGPETQTKRYPGSPASALRPPGTLFRFHPQRGWTLWHKSGELSAEYRFQWVPGDRVVCSWSLLCRLAEVSAPDIVSPWDRCPSPVV